MNETKTELKRELGLFTCVLLVIGNIIGVGIFTTPGEIARDLPSAGWILIAWSVGGLLAMAGALTYAELGAMIPKAGGNYVFLKEAYGPLWGFLYGWAYTLVTSSGTIALLAIGFGEYLGIATGTPVSKFFSITVVLVLTLLNMRDVKLGAGLMDIITSTKIVAMFALVVFGFILGNGQTSHFSPLFTGETSLVFKAIGAALVPMAFAYSGWNSTVFVAEEVKNPGRLIPLSMIFGTLATALIYILMNAIYLYAVPLQNIIGSETVADLAARNLFGEGAAVLIKLLVATSVLGCLSATMLTNPRTTFALARDGYFFKFTAKVHEKFRTPSGAILFSGLWACFLILMGDFKQILRFLSVPLVIIGTMTVFSIFVFRWKKPEINRPYRCWGYPFTPALYVLISIFMLYATFLERRYTMPIGFGGFSVDVPVWLTGIGIFIMGVPVFYVWRRFRHID
ncbi:MAG: Serine/threonine exchanger SteT [Elusimicrobia bacterium]|nr:Serine/threonine exchanger SteT [Elusimicrobiota bacterium]